MKSEYIVLNSQIIYNHLMNDEKKKEKKLARKLRRKNSADGQHTPFYYSFLTFVLLICLIQMGVSALLNVTKVIAYKSKLATLENKQIKAKARNEELHKEIKDFKKTDSMEAIARNSLHQAGENEWLMILNEKEEPQPEKNKYLKFGHKKQ